MSVLPRPRLEPIRPRGRDDAVLEHLATWVEQAGLQPGDRLPPERELAQHLGVGRGTVREALKRWAAMGLVDMRLGSGTYLKSRISANLAHVGLTFPLELPQLLEVLEVRRALEGEAAKLAAERATPAALAAMKEALEAMETVHGRLGTAPDEDWLFHLSLYRAAGNELFLTLIKQLQDLMHRFWEHPFGAENFAARSFPLHRQLYDAVRAKDAPRARAIADEIISITHEDLLEAARGP